MRIGNLPGLAIACAAMAGPGWPGGTLAQTVPPKPAPPPGMVELARPVLSAKDTRKNDNFVEANLLFMAYHELGHALFSEFDVPIVGREEDAADRLATYMMTPDKGEEGGDFLIDAIIGWFAAAGSDRLDRIAWWSAHGTEEQRAFQVSCLLYGADPPRFRDVANLVELPRMRRDSCAVEARRNESAWDRLLDPHVRLDDPDDHAPLKSVSMTYEPTRAYAAERAFVEKIELLEELRRLLTDIYKMKPGIALSTQECGEPNAFWRATSRRLTICYELVRKYRNIAELPDEE